MPTPVREGGEVHTVFFGGGTPSLLPSDTLREIFACLRGAFEITPDAEITLEANPGTVGPEYLEELRALGINRLSLGAQSAQPDELRLLGRRHRFEHVVEAVKWGRQAGFGDINLDLIYGLPHQTLAAWQDTLQRALALGPDHLALYALSLEDGTPLRASVERGRLPIPDPDLAADMYEWASEALAQHGFAQYEISNWARDSCQSTVASEQCATPAFACRHNLQYWRNQQYLGFGAGAHGCVYGWRYANVRSPRAYIARMGRQGRGEFPFSPALECRTALDRRTEMGETMLLGLRLTSEGVREADFGQRFGVGLAQAYGRELAELQARGLVSWDAQGVRLTRAARLVANQVFQAFI